MNSTPSKHWVLKNKTNSWVTFKWESEYPEMIKYVFNMVGIPDGGTDFVLDGKCFRSAHEYWDMVEPTRQLWNSLITKGWIVCDTQIVEYDII